MFNGLRWLESLLERAGISGAVEEAYGSLRARVLGPPAESRRSLMEETPRRFAVDTPAPVSPAPTQQAAVWPVKPLVEESNPGESPKAPRTRKAAPVRKKTARKPAARKTSRAPVGSAASAARAVPAEPADTVGVLVGALRAHPRQEELLAAGRRKDQLLRSLIPLYLARVLDLEVTSGTTSRFWGEFGVTYAAPNAAKALRLHTGFTQDTKKGKAITPKGVKYVESALAS